MVLKCYACIRGCGYLKGVLGGVLLLLTAYLMTSTPEGLHCSHLLHDCLLDFGVLVDQMANKANFHLTRESEVTEYCECFASCINYMSVFHTDGMKIDRRNCFRKSAKVGLPGISTSGEATGTSAVPVLPTLSTRECTTCTDAVRTQGEFSTGLGWLCAFCGVGMFMTAGCEHVELKFHNSIFSVGVLVLDAVCGLMLSIATFVSIEGARVALGGCDPETFAEALKVAGTDSVTGDINKAAIFADFLALMLKPLGQEVCSDLRPLSVCALVTALCGLANLWSAFITCLLCLGCTDDGLDDNSDDDKAADLHDLMTFN